MRRLLAVALVTFMAAGVANAQGVLQSEWTGDQPAPYSDTQPRDAYAYWEGTPSPYFMPMGNYGFFGIADDIRFGGPQGSGNPINMTSFEVGWYSRITAALAPLTMEVRFYSYFTDAGPYYGGYPFIGAQYGPTYTITGLGTGRHTYGDPPLYDGPQVVTVDGPPVWLPCGTWMEVGFYDATGNLATWTGVYLANDWQAEVGVTSHDYYFGMLGPGSVGGWYWNGGYTPTLPMTDPNWNPASNFQLGISVPEPLTLGLVALGGLLAVRRRR
jgi:hypothetical protein